MAAHKQNVDGITTGDIEHIRHKALVQTPETVQYMNLKQNKDMLGQKQYGWRSERVHVGLSPADVQVYCNQDRDWQTVRLAMKGLTTLQKLIVLDWWWRKKTAEARNANDHWRLKVQTTNYITALRRGGLLTVEDWIQR